MVRSRTTSRRDCQPWIHLPSRAPVQVSWAKGSSKKPLGGEDLPLPPLPLPEAAGEPVTAWVRFNADPKGGWPGEGLRATHRTAAAPRPCQPAARGPPPASPTPRALLLRARAGQHLSHSAARPPSTDLHLEVSLRVVAVAAQPSTWSVALVDYSAAAAQAGARGRTAPARLRC